MQRRSLLKAAAAAPLLRPRAVAHAAFQDDGTAISTPAPATDRMAGAILPDYRVLCYYGFPGNEFMGILGEHDPSDLLALLQQQADAYAAVDDSRPFKLAFEVIASVAQRDPMADGSYLSYTARDYIDEYVKFTREHDLLLLLDMQYGRRTTKQEIDAVLEWLREPHVHLALDPEFHVQEDEIPGEDLGSIDAKDISYAQKRLARFSEDQHLPPKLLVVHQFKLYSISNRENVRPLDGVQLVLDVDGWGAPDEKRGTYDVLANVPTIDYYGFKLWYQQDEPLMTEAEVLALSPSPDLIIYQ